MNWMQKIKRYINEPFFGFPSVFFWSIICLVLIPSAFLFGYRQIYSWNLPIDAERFGYYGSFVCGIAGFFNLLGIIWIYRTYKQTVEANTMSNQNDQANAFVNLYLSHTTSEFFRHRQAAWRVLTNCLSSKEYSDYMVKTFFVSEYIGYKDGLPEDEKNLIYSVYSSMKNTTPDEKTAILDKEYTDRHYLDDYLNFYNLLAMRKDALNAMKQCDFYYDWWRPMLWWICDKRYAVYLSDPNKREYSTNPNLYYAALERLDTICDFETLHNPHDRWLYYTKHPLIKTHVKDPLTLDNPFKQLKPDISIVYEEPSGELSSYCKITSGSWAKFDKSKEQSE